MGGEEWGTEFRRYKIKPERWRGVEVDSLNTEERLKYYSISFLISSLNLLALSIEVFALAIITISPIS